MPVSRLLATLGAAAFCMTLTAQHVADEVHVTVADDVRTVVADSTADGRTLPLPADSCLTDGNRRMGLPLQPAGPRMTFPLSPLMGMGWWPLHEGLNAQVELSLSTGFGHHRLRGVGFAYGNDTLRLTAVSDTCTALFQATTQALQPGTYFAVAFAENGVGKTIGTDTIYFEIPAEELE